MNFVAFERAKQGTGASRRLRNSGKTPGIVYGGAGEPQLIELDHNALWHALKKEAFHSSILDMELAGKASQVLLRDVQMHPFKEYSSLALYLAAIAVAFFQPYVSIALYVAVALIWIVPDRRFTRD